MALSLPEGAVTGHISWASRGWRQPVEGHTPVTAPGALEGWRFSDVLRRRSDGWSIHGIVAPRGSENPFPAVWRAIWSSGPEFSTSSGMYSCWGHGMRLLDGRVSYDAADYGFSGSPNILITGRRAVRLLANRLGVRPPRRLPGERSIPTPVVLEQELLDQLRAELGPDVGATPLDREVPRIFHGVRGDR